MGEGLVASINRFWAGRSLRAKALAVLLLPLPLLIAASASMYRAQRGEQDARAWVQHSLEVRADIQEVLVRLLDAESSARDFLLSGDPASLHPYWESREVLGPLADHLTNFVVDNPPQFKRANETRELSRNEMDGLAALCQNASKLGGNVNGVELLDGGRDLASRIRGKLTAMQMEEDRLLQARSQAMDSARLRLCAVLVEGVLLALFFQLAGALLLTGSLSRQIRALEANARMFGDGMPGHPFVAETAEARNLEDGLQQASARFTEREHELREHEDRLRALFQNAPLACHEIDPQGVVRRINPAACTLLGYPADEMIGD